jgi:hypothetical protein
MQKKSQIIAGMFLSAAVILAVSFQATTSLDPTEVFRGRDPVPKVVIGFFAFSLYALQQTRNSKAISG